MKEKLCSLIGQVVKEAMEKNHQRAPQAYKDNAS